MSLPALVFVNYSILLFRLDCVLPIFLSYILWPSSPLPGWISVISPMSLEIRQPRFVPFNLLFIQAPLRVELRCNLLCGMKSSAGVKTEEIGATSPEDSPSNFTPSAFKSPCLSQPPSSLLPPTLPSTPRSKRFPSQTDFCLLHSLNPVVGFSLAHPTYSFSYFLSPAPES